jgi:hypothetical protein
MPREPETTFALDYLAENLARAQARWGEEVLALVDAVAMSISKSPGSVSENELAAWCSRHDLPTPDLKYLFNRSRSGEWTYLRAGAWRFNPSPLAASGADWRRKWLPASPPRISDQRAGKPRPRVPRRGED